jgi:hypothetical protein
MDLGHVREEGANEPTRNLHHGDTVAQESEASGKVDASIDNNGDIGASTR